LRGFQAKSLARLSDATPKQLWAAVNPKRHRCGPHVNKAFLDVDAVNTFFANIATDINYNADNVLTFKQDY